MRFALIICFDKKFSAQGEMIGLGFYFQTLHKNTATMAMSTWLFCVVGVRVGDFAKPAFDLYGKPADCKTMRSLCQILAAIPGIWVPGIFVGTANVPKNDQTQW